LYFNDTILQGSVKFTSGSVDPNPFHNRVVGVTIGSCINPSITTFSPYCVGSFYFSEDGSIINTQGYYPPAGGKVQKFSIGINSGSGKYAGISGSVSVTQSAEDNQWIYKFDIIYPWVFLEIQ